MEGMAKGTDLPVTGGLAGQSRSEEFDGGRHAGLKERLLIERGYQPLQDMATRSRLVDNEPGR